MKFFKICAEVHPCRSSLTRLYQIGYLDWFINASFLTAQADLIRTHVPRTNRFSHRNYFRILSSTVLLYSAISGKLINLEEDELEFYIGEEDTYDDSNYTFMAELKSADK